MIRGISSEKIWLVWLALLCCGAGLVPFGRAADQTIQTTESFLREALGGGGTAANYTLTAADQTAARAILGHGSASRVRYWKSGKRTAWVLEEIGKHRLITTGFAVDDDKIHLVRVLTYREPYGWEVKHSFFTKQFSGAKLGGAPRYDLSKRVSNISGATLSVNALRKLSRWALYLDSRVSG